MFKIIISPDYCIEQEEVVIADLLNMGFDYYHYRKPQEDSEEIREYLESIDIELRSKVVCHQDQQWASKQGFKAHKKSNALTEHRLSFHSTSIHAMSELDSVDNQFRYIFAGPVFPSISKAGYSSNIDWLNVKRTTEHSLVALGGLDINNIELIPREVFSGYAFSGAIFQDLSLIEVNAQRIIKKLKSIEGY